MEGVQYLMVTINKVIEKAAMLRPDCYSDEIKCAWISELDGKISRETMHKENFQAYSFPEDCEKELLVKKPYDNIYELYIVAMSDFFSGELGNYSASSVMFEKAYEEFRKNYIRNHMPPQHGVQL